MSSTRFAGPLGVTLVGLLTSSLSVAVAACGTNGDSSSAATSGTGGATTSSSSTASAGGGGEGGGTGGATATSASSTSSGPPPSGYVLKDDLTGTALFDAFEFEAIGDPTHGAVTYVDGATAWSKGLVSIDKPTGHARIAVESKAIATGSGRESVRLKSKAAYQEGLFLIDVVHMPQGNGTWPSFWTLGAGSWPAGGEIDIIEGVNDRAFNTSTLHTSPDCSMASVDAGATMTGTYGERDCNAGDKVAGMPYIGCGTTAPPGSFGPSFNDAGGGVFAMAWTKSAIDVWFWPRASVPADVEAGMNPDPLGWGLPTSHFALGNECSPAHFTEHRMILNTTLCGDWAGGVFDGPGGKGPAACADYVKNNPSAFAKAFWELASLRTFTFQP